MTTPASGMFAQTEKRYLKSKMQTESMTVKELKPCPICGAKAFLEAEIIDGAFKGYSVGCPRYALYDGIHGHGQDTPSEERLVFHGFYTEEEAASVWNRRAERG